MKQSVLAAFVGFDVRTRLSMLKSSAKSRGIFINLDINKYQELINLGCHFCGNDLSQEKGYCLDRVDNNKGYMISNVVPCCKICNRAKSNMNVWEFSNWVIKAAKHIKNNINIAKKMVALGASIESTDKLYNELLNEKTNKKEKHKLVYKPNKEHV